MPHKRPEEPTRLVAIRHGETDWNTQTRVQGQLDIGLNAAGRHQARRLGQALAGGDRPEMVYSSDLIRARDTAQCVALACGLELRCDAGLRERSAGAFEGRTLDEVQVDQPEAAARWRARDPAFVPPGGESLQALSARCIDTLARLAARHPGGTVAVVTHGGVLDCLYRAAMGLPLDAPRSWHIPNAAINRLSFAQGRWAVLDWGDVVHLAGGPGSLDDVADAAA